MLIRVSFSPGFNRVRSHVPGFPTTVSTVYRGPGKLKPLKRLQEDLSLLYHPVETGSESKSGKSRPDSVDLRERAAYGYYR